MRGNLKSWLWVVLPFVLLLAVWLNIGVDRRYSEAEITPDLCREMVRRDYARYGHSINVNNVEIIDIQKVNDVTVAGYSLGSGNLGILEFRQWGKNYIFHMRRNAYEFSRCEGLAFEEFSTNEPREDYVVFLNKSENLRKIRFWQGTYPDWEYELEACPVMLIYPRPTSGRYSFLDAEGNEVEYLQLNYSE